MTARTATPDLVRQRVAEVLSKRPDAQFIVMRAALSWNAGELVTPDGRPVHVVPCPSPLAVRSTLSTTSGRPADGLTVMLCDLSDHDLGTDVLARVTPSRVVSLDPWRAAAALFGADDIDSGFRSGDGWIADALLESSNEVTAPVAVGRVLTLDTALDALARGLLGAEHLDVDSVLRAAQVVGAFADLASPPTGTQRALLAELATREGPLGELVAAILTSGLGQELLPLGLVARAIYGDGDVDGGKAAGRFEARCGAGAIAPHVGAALASRCETLVVTLDRTDLDRANQIVATAESLVRHLEPGSSSSSELLPVGFDRRVVDASTSLTALLDAIDRGSASAGELEHVRASVSRVQDHREARSPAGKLRAEHLTMAARLATWLATLAADEAQSFERAARTFAEDGAWVDRARRRLWRGDSDDTVGDTHRRIVDAVAARRAVQNRRFAELLAAWSTNPAAPTALATASLVTVEAILNEIVAPLARAVPVVLVVLDGCAIPSFVELAPQFSTTGLREIVLERPDPWRWTGIAALPTVTEVSRASLLAGYLDQGGQDHERRRFEAHTGLGAPGPRLFHQNALLGAAGSSLSAALADALDDAGPRTVGAVVNTIDDQLKKGDFTTEYRLADLHALPWILQAARDQGRAVVVTADHGHVLAQPADGGMGAYQGGGTGGERWRAADREAGDNEVVLRGPRVLVDREPGAVIAPWDDDFRYGSKSGGYHGGATPEEVLVPVAVFLPAGLDPPDGWQTWSEPEPLWWDLRVHRATPASIVTPPSRPRLTKRKTGDGQGSMFDPPVAVEAPPETVVDEPAWLGALLTSEVWKLQRRATPRATLPDDRVRRVLTALVRRGGVASYAVLAADAEILLSRLPGFLAVLARILNVEGYPVLDVDASAQEARLSTQYLAQQFEIDVT